MEESAQNDSVGVLRESTSSSRRVISENRSRIKEKTDAVHVSEPWNDGVAG